MAKFIAIYYFITIIATILAKPATNEQLDKVTVNDVAANSVTIEKKNDTPVIENTENVENKKETPTVQISGITTGFEQPSISTSPPFKPQRAGTAFARLIDDIFQIPINVLQNVAKLITSPFTGGNKDKKTDAVE